MADTVQTMDVAQAGTVEDIAPGAGGDSRSPVPVNRRPHRAEDTSIVARFWAYTLAGLWVVFFFTNPHTPPHLGQRVMPLVVFVLVVLPLIILGIFEMREEEGVRWIEAIFRNLRFAVLTMTLGSFFIIFGFGLLGHLFLG